MIINFISFENTTEIEESNYPLNFYLWCKSVIGCISVLFLYDKIYAYHRSSIYICFLIW